MHRELKQETAVGRLQVKCQFTNACLLFLILDFIYNWAGFSLHPLFSIMGVNFIEFVGKIMLNKKRLEADCVSRPIAFAKLLADGL